MSKRDIIYGYYCGDVFPDCEWEEYSEDKGDLIEEIKFHLEKKHKIFEFDSKLMMKIKNVITEEEDEEEDDDEFDGNDEVDDESFDYDEY